MFGFQAKFSRPNIASLPRKVPSSSQEIPSEVTFQLQSRFLDIGGVTAYATAIYVLGETQPEIELLDIVACIYPISSKDISSIICATI